MAMAVWQRPVLAADGLVIESVKRPQGDYGTWIMYLNDSGISKTCALKNLSTKGGQWRLECPAGNYRITRSFEDRFKITREGEKAGYINEAGYFIQTQLHEIRRANKDQWNQWLLQGSGSVLSASFSDMKDWKAFFFSLDGAKQGEMILTWAFSDLTEMTVKDDFQATTEEQKRDKFLVVFATIFSSIMSRP